MPFVTDVDINTLEKKQTSQYEYFSQSPYHKKSLYQELGLFKRKPKAKGPSYKDLEITKKERETIQYITRVVATTPGPKLWGKKKELTDLGETLGNVHPLKFLEAIFATEEMKEMVRTIFTGSFSWAKRGQYMKGIQGGLDAKAKMNDLEPYLDDFAKAIGVKKEEIAPFFENRDWEGLVRYLMNH